MLFSKAELQPTPIIENKTIQKTLPFKFENKLLPFQLGKCEYDRCYFDVCSCKKKAIRQQNRRTSIDSIVFASNKSLSE